MESFILTSIPDRPKLQHRNQSDKARPEARPKGRREAPPPTDRPSVRRCAPAYNRNMHQQKHTGQQKHDSMQHGMTTGYLEPGPLVRSTLRTFLGARPTPGFEDLGLGSEI